VGSRPLSVIVALLGAGLLAPAAPALDLDAIKRTGSLRLLAVASNQENEFLNSGSDARPGFDREVLEGFAKSQRLKLVIVPLEAWDALVPALLAGRGDLIGGRFTATDARRKHIDFTDEVLPTRTVVVTRKPRPRVTRLEQLAGEMLGTLRSSSMAEDLAAAGVPVGRVDLGIVPGGVPEALRSGRITAAVWTLEAAILERERDPQIELGLYLGRPSSLAYGVRKEDPRLREALNAHIRLLRQTGTWNRLVVKYFGDTALELLKAARQ